MVLGLFDVFVVYSNIKFLRYGLFICSALNHIIRFFIIDVHIIFSTQILWCVQWTGWFVVVQWTDGLHWNVIFWMVPWTG